MSHTLHQSILAGFLITAAIGLRASASLFGDVIVHYNFESIDSPLTDVVGTSGMTATDLTPGAQAAANSERCHYSRPRDGGRASYKVSGDALAPKPGTTLEAFVAAQSAGAFFEFTLEADEGDALDLTSLRFDVAHKTGGAHELRVLVTSDIAGDAYSNRLAMGDGGSIPNVLQGDQGEIGIADASGRVNWGISDNTVVTLGSEFNNIASATFRLYAFSIRGSGGGAANDLLRFDNILVKGALVDIPEPSSAALMGGLLALGHVMVRRRCRG